VVASASASASASSGGKQRDGIRDLVAEFYRKGRSVGNCDSVGDEDDGDGRRRQ
jgi:hypothetical protein